jgi:S-DNA-T family DNA segregation ATPase FtsK/SpoIIIE
MVDPKMLELSIYEGIPHLLLPVVTDPKKAAAALRWACDEMDRRYELMMNAGVRDIRGFNAKVAGQAPPEPLPSTDEPPFDADPALEGVEPVAIGARGWAGVMDDRPTKLPYIVVVIDEFADLMMVAGKEVEFCVGRIAQKARAAGIHLILATQRPSTDVITGVIKANFPTRIAFQVSSGIDSRTILQQNGAEQLLGKGDMLFVPPGTGHLKRVHGAYVSEEEIHKVVEFIRSQGEPKYLDESILRSPDDTDDGDDESLGDQDPLYEECVRIIFKEGRASTSHLQRRLSLGYNRAARIIDQMERDGLLGPGEGAKPRNINKRLIGELVSRWDGDSAMVN